MVGAFCVILDVYEILWRWVIIHLRILILLISAFSLAAVLYFAPAEKTLGESVKIVYIHAATITVGTYLFYLAGLLGIFVLISPKDKLVRLLKAIQKTTLTLWLIGVLVSVLAMGIIWKVFFWQEPLLAIVVIMLAITSFGYYITRRIEEPKGIAIVNILLAVVLFINTNTGYQRVMHPVDPIGISESQAIQGSYLFVVAIMSIVVLSTVWIIYRSDNYGEGRKDRKKPI